ncbi:hypothetical protein [Sphingomonas sp. PP-CE-1G-424]|uniref:hypothetical protein n=1 Tax=Sphingomonas sp. PP-CE-1G-424 TaxID=2135658 RepID=UPI0010543016|nr:hypothetical protein [Sphingomonas sp. PP-CE-1G-424]TCP71362.1 hypothetical protein C8J43_102440 [Sphingomonas sp. PP-CE-1G-424]
MTEQITTVERAFELARSGTCSSVNDLRQRLRREGYDAVHLHLHGASINKQLVDLMHAAKGSSGAE